MIAFFWAWLRRYFTIDESRLRARIYLHEGLDPEAATAHWSVVTGILPTNFTSLTGQFQMRRSDRTSMSTAVRMFGIHVRKPIEGFWVLYMPC